MDSTRRFSDRVEHYVRWRPRWPDGILDVLRDEAGLVPDSAVADVGSGTGLSAEPLLRHGCAVFGVEPNRAMREAAERLLAGWPRFTSVDGTAEATTLEDASVDLVTAGQAFHWFDVDAARREFARILRPGGRVALLWNTRKTGASPFLRAYEALLRRHGTDYDAVRHDRVSLETFARFFAGGRSLRRALDNEQRFDLQGLAGRLLSSSYVPAPGAPGHAAMMGDLEAIFREHARDGVVRFEYDTEIHVGRVAP